MPSSNKNSINLKMFPYHFANICFVIVTISHQIQVKWGGCAIISSLPMEEVKVCLFSNFPPATYHLAPPAAGGDWKQEEPNQPRQGGGFAGQENVSSKICHGEDSGEDRWRFRWRMLLCVLTQIPRWVRRECWLSPVFIWITSLNPGEEQAVV